MADQYTGECVVGLMRTIDANLRRVENNEDIPEPKVEVGGLIVTVDGLKVSLGPEVIESFQRIEAEKRQAIASGKPFERGVWQTNDEEVKAQMRAVAAAAGFPGLFD